MTIIRSKRSVREFYAHALAQKKNTAENLNAPTSDRFNRLLWSMTSETPPTAIDLGYGAGNYTLAMARSGFSVVAVDQISGDGLRELARSEPDLTEMITVTECLIERYPIGQEFGLLVARDVLHYLTKTEVGKVLGRAVSLSGSQNVHYLEVFTDISRTSLSGEPIHIEGEAHYSSEEFEASVADVYRGWDVTCFRSRHAEQDSTTGRIHFESTRVTVVAKRRPHRSRGKGT